MNKLLTKIVGVALGATMAVGVGVGVSVKSNRETIDSEVHATSAYTEHFDSSDFVTSTTYNNSSENEHGPTNYKWGVLCGTPYSGGANSTGKSIQMRYYKSVGSTPYLLQKFNVDNVVSVSFYAKVSDTKNKITVKYSTDSGSTWSAGEQFTCTTSWKTYTFLGSNTTTFEHFRLKFECGTSVEKSGIFIDEIDYVQGSSGPAKTINVSSVTIKDSTDTTMTDTVIKNGVSTEDSLQLNATVNYSQDPDLYVDGAGEVEWDSTDKTVATISSSGLVNYLANGTTTISAKSKDGTNKDDKVASFTLDIRNIVIISYDYVVDEITLNDTGAFSSSYTSWSDVRKASGAVYSGSTSKSDNGGMGFRQAGDKDASGIIVTASEGVATKVEVTWTSTTSSRTVNIKGQDTAYETIEHSADVTGTLVGQISYSSTVANLSDYYKYICIYTNNTASFSSIKITWKVVGASVPLTANPVLSTGASTSVVAGREIALSVTTTPAESDERLIIKSNDATKVAVSGTGKSFTIRGVAVGSTTVSVTGAKGTYSASVAVTVTEPVKTFEDKILTPASVGIVGGGYSANNTAPHENDGVSYSTYNIQLSSGAFQFKANEGYIQNSEVLYVANAVDAKIKAITLFLNSSNNGTASVYEGTSVGPSTPVAASVSNGDIVSFTFSSGMTYFKIKETGNSSSLLVDKIVVELVDSTDDVLNKVRTAAQSILDDMDGFCGEADKQMTADQWTVLNNHLTALNLSDSEKLLLKNSTRLAIPSLEQGSATIENAMYHYDACVTLYGYSPLAGITNATPSMTNAVNGFSNSSSASSITIIVVIALSMSMISVGFFLIRKRKEER